MKFTTDFTTVNVFIKAMIEEEIKASLNAIPVLICKYSNHPDDDYLYLYIAQSKTDEYIAGLANTSRNGYVGLYENHYNCTFKQAMGITMDKIKDCNTEEM
jgi:hypothetical protein